MQALHLFQEVLDQGLIWGPEITYTMIKASLDLQAAGVEDALAVAHTVMDTFERQGGSLAGWLGVAGRCVGWLAGGVLGTCTRNDQHCLLCVLLAAGGWRLIALPPLGCAFAGLFIDVENGTEVLLLAVRRDVGDLSLAHRVYDSMRKTQRWAAALCTLCTLCHTMLCCAMPVLCSAAAPVDWPCTLMRQTCRCVSLCAEHATCPVPAVPAVRAVPLLRVPKTPCMFKYMRALASREPDNRERLLEVGAPPLPAQKCQPVLDHFMPACPPANRSPPELNPSPAGGHSPCLLQLCGNIMSDPDRWAGQHAWFCATFAAAVACC